MAKSRINKMRTQKRVKRKTQKRMNKRKNKIYKKSKKINKYFYSGGSSVDDVRVGETLGEIGRKTEKQLLDYLRNRGGTYHEEGIKVTDMLHLFRLIQVVEVRFDLNPDINAWRRSYDKGLAGETVNMNRYTNDEWPPEDYYDEAHLLNAEYIGELLTWMDNAAYHDIATNMARTWAWMIAYDAEKMIQGFDDHHERRNPSVTAMRRAHRTGDITSDSLTPYLTFPDRGAETDEEKNRLAKERMQAGLETLFVEGVIELSHTDSLGVIHGVVDVLGEQGARAAARRVLESAVTTFLEPYPHEEQVMISKIIHDKVYSESMAGRMMAHVGHAAAPALPDPSSFVVPPPPGEL